jgi:alkylation response protein AidB-like acyl-CoA dehydrogenase
MSEPDAGSDVASLRTSARPCPNGWTISGTKIWTSGAAHAEFCYLVARSEPTAPAHKGLSEFIVAMDSPGIEVSPITDMTGDRHFCEVSFDEVFVPADRLVGEPNQAFGQIMRQMEHERGGIDRLASNRRLALDAVDAVRPIETLRTRWADLESRYRIGRLMVLREVLGSAYPGYSAVTKTWCTEYEVEVAASSCAGRRAGRRRREGRVGFAR